MSDIVDVVVDFDGTVVTHEYPRVGKDVGAVPVLKKLVENGKQLILFTMRSGKELQDAVDWFSNNGIKLYGVQTNPSQRSWTSSPKAYGQLYIDDAALGVPLIKKPFARPYVNWVQVELLLKEMGVLPLSSLIEYDDLKELFVFASEENMNGEKIYDLHEEVVSDFEVKIHFKMDTHYSENDGYVTINTETQQVCCYLPESHEGGGIEESFEDHIKVKLGWL